MATILERINTIVRNELADEIKSRWDDSQLMIFFQQAVRRANTIGQINKLKFMRNSVDVVIASSETDFPLPSDYLTPISLTRLDNKKALTVYDGPAWDTIISTGDLTTYFIDDPVVEVKGASSADTSLRFRYYVSVDPDDLLISSQTPWNGKLDYLLCEYVALRARKVDRYDINVDATLMDELEKNIIGTYIDQAPTTIKSKGWT